MNKLFADTAYWVALLDRQDSLHQQSVQVARQLGTCYVFTTELVLIEVLNGFSKNLHLKQSARNLVAGLTHDPRLTIVPQTELC